MKELMRRASDDADELLSRGNPGATDEKEPRDWFEPITYAGRLENIQKSVAEEIKPGLWDRILEESTAEDSEAIREYQAGLADFLTQEKTHAINGLVFLSRRIATYLEHLTATAPALMRSIAAESDLWPVNLGLKKAKTGKALLRRLTFAKDYLTGLDLCSRPKFRHSEASGAVSESPFKEAAKALYNEMVGLRQPWQLCMFRVKTPWLKRLVALKFPMTPKNAPEWWRLGRVYLSERWNPESKEFRKEFGPLIKHLGLNLSIKTPYPSSIKSRVIDNDLKDAFLALAVAD